MDLVDLIIKQWNDYVAQYYEIQALDEIMDFVRGEFGCC